MMRLGWILDLNNYRLGLSRWTQGSTIELSQELFSQYINIVKPKIHVYHQGNQIDKSVITLFDPNRFSFYSEELAETDILNLRGIYGN